MITDEEVGAFLEHYGVKGMKWGVRKDKTGVRPIARSLSKSKFGDASRKNADRHNKRAAAKTAAIKEAKKQAKVQLPGNSNKADVKAASKMSKGEKVASFLVAGPAGMAVYKGGKIVSAKSELSKSSPKEVSARKAEVKIRAKMSGGEKVATFIIGGPPGMLVYKGGKIVGANIAVRKNS
jgi:hypothetical protein